MLPRKTNISGLRIFNDQNLAGRDYLLERDAGVYYILMFTRVRVASAYFLTHKKVCLIFRTANAYLQNGKTFTRSPVFPFTLLPVFPFTCSPQLKQQFIHLLNYFIDQ
jgi:hypothetical protein